MGGELQMKIFRSVFLANFREMTRDKMSLFWFIAFPVILVILFGTIFQVIKDFEHIMPGLLGLSLMQSGLFGSLRFLELREKKVLRGLSTTPLPKIILFASELLLRVLVALVQASLILIIAHIVFGVTIVGFYF